MSSDLLERYRDALRRGHLASRAGRLAEAAAAYEEATQLGPDRAVPHVSLGDVHRRLGQPDAALGSYLAALGRAPRDEAALAGRAAVLERLGRPAEAADVLDLLAEVQSEAGRLADACETLCQALELAERKDRRRELGETIVRLRESLGPRDGDQHPVLARALRIVDSSVGRTASVADGPGQAGLAAADASGAEAEPEPDLPAPQQPGAEAAAAPLDALPGGIALMASADAALDGGDRESALLDYLGAARALARDGRTAAALDACYAALMVAPGSPDLHLQLATIYLDLGWTARAADKLMLLGRLITLDGDMPARERLCAIVAASFPGDQRLAGLCS